VARGCVYIVGAGPGAPDLITLRGLETLKRADVVLYDRLVHPSLLDHAPPHAQRVYAGRAPGEPGTGRQDGIHEQLIAHARAGRTVVRLKGGDPFVFGRGGEEVQALTDAGVPWEVVPGISAAIAGPGAALVPVTYRGVSAAFGVFTGHEADDSATANVDWALAAAMPTAVIMMGVHHLDEIVTRLIEHGRAEDAPAMIVERATWPDQRVIVAPLAELPRRALGIRAPATLVVGEVVRLRERTEAFTPASQQCPRFQPALAPRGGRRQQPASSPGSGAR